MKLVLSIIFSLMCLLASTANADTLNLVASYSFSGNVNDGSGNGHNGIVYGALPEETETHFVADRFGNANSAYHFDEINDYIRIPNSSDFDLTGSWKISVGLKLESGGVVLNSVKAMHDDEGGWGMRVEPSFMQSVMYHAPFDNANFEVADNIPLGIWTDIEWRFDKPTNTVEVYRDGVLKGTSHPIYSMMATTRDLLIGAAQGETDDPYDLQVPFSGTIDNLQIYAPEPATLFLLTLGGLILRRRK
jgi:Concanavalin A-like lectin/glucanases superfamily